MRTTGRVISDHQVELDDPLPAGTVVKVIPVDEEEGFEVDEIFEAELLNSIAQGERGETVSAEDVLRRLKNR